AARHSQASLSKLPPRMTRESAIAGGGRLEAERPQSVERGERVLRLMAGGEVELDLAAVEVDARSSVEDLGVRPPEAQDLDVVACDRQLLRDNGDAARRQRLDQLALRAEDVLERADQLEVRRADVRDHADVRSGDLAELRDL